MTEDPRIEKVTVRDDEIYFVFRSAKGRFVECVLEYNEDIDKLEVRANDHMVGFI